jgi:iron complex transport system substrate-binding protein
MSSLRIVSLIASATEIVHALGLGDCLVGRSHECDYPPSVLALPICSEAKLDVNSSSRQIDERVKQVLADATSVYRVLTPALEELQPTHLITQTQCEVCAVSLKDVQAAACELISSKPDVVACEPNCLADVWTDMMRVADRTGFGKRGEELVAALQGRLATLQHRASFLKTRPTIACIEWIDPLMAAGNWVPELVELAGGVNLFGKAGKHSPWMTFSELLTKDPDVIAVMPCGFDIKRATEEMQPLIAERGWRDLRAVQNRRVFITDGNAYFNRPGPRLVESAEILFELLHPGVGDAVHEGTGWVQWNDA